MNKFKQIGKTRIRSNGKTYKGYMLGDLPPTFAYISKEEINEFGDTIDMPGVSSWFNYKGLTYV